MFKSKKRVLSIFLVIMLIIGVIPTNNVEAATKKTTVKTIKVSGKKIKSSTTYKNIVAIASSDNYDMSLRYTNNGDLVLSYSKTGTKYTDIDIVKLAGEKLELPACEMTIYDVTYLDNKFYITGTYYIDDVPNNFYLATTDGVKFTFGKINVEKDEFGYLYKVGSTFIYTVPVGADMNGDISTGVAVYYTSKDLKTWTEVSTPTLPKHLWRLESVTETGMIVSADEDISIDKDTSVSDYYEWKTAQLYYTTDFNTFKKVDEGINYDVLSYFSAIPVFKAGMRVEWNWDSLNDLNLHLLSSDNYTKWNTIFDYNSSNYSSDTVDFHWMATRDDLNVFVEREKDNSLFIYSDKTKKFTEYSTTLKASLIGRGAYSDNDEYTYEVYNKNYILVSKDNFKTTYKFKAPISNIQGINTVGNVLVIQGTSNYYIPVKNIKKAIAASNK